MQEKNSIKIKIFTSTACNFPRTDRVRFWESVRSPEFSLNRNAGGFPGIPQDGFRTMNPRAVDISDFLQNKMKPEGGRKEPVKIFTLSGGGHAPAGR